MKELFKSTIQKYILFDVQGDGTLFKVLTCEIFALTLDQEYNFVLTFG